MKRKPTTAKYETFESIPVDALDALPGPVLYKGAHVRAFTSKLRKTVTGPSGEVLFFVNPTIKGAKVWRALVAWRPEEGDHYEQFVNVTLLRLENAPPPEPRGQIGEELKHGDCSEGGDHVFTPDVEYDPTGNTLNCEKCGAEQPQTHCPGDPDDEQSTCGGELRFDPDLVGDTCGGLTLRGWMVCEKCGRAWIAPKGMGVAYDGAWKLAGGGRSVETGIGRIRVDGGTNVEALMARIAKLPELELEVARLRKDRGRGVHLPAKEEPEIPRGESSPWSECKLVVNGIELKDGDRILRINQPDSKDNGVYVVRLERS